MYKATEEMMFNPYTLSLYLEKNEAKVSIIDGAWIWDVIIKYFPLASHINWKTYLPIVKKAIKLCNERGTNIAIVMMTGKLSKKEKKWLENGFYWRVQRFPRIGKITKKDAKMLQEHKYNIIRGLANSGKRVLTSVGYEVEEAKQIFFNGITKELEKKNLLPAPEILKLEKKNLLPSPQRKQIKFVKGEK